MAFWSQLNNAPKSPAELCKHRMESDSVEVLIQFVFSSAMEFIFLKRFQVMLMLLVPGPDLGSTGLEWTYLVCLRSLFRNCLVSAPQHFWNSFQGEPEPPRSPGGPGSLCHCPKAQENGSSGCPSLPDTTWGCGSGQGQQQEVDQREHAGDEQGCGQRVPKENIIVSLFSIDKIASCDFS